MSAIAEFLEAFWLGMALHLWQTSLVLALLVVVALGLRRAPALYTEMLGWIALLKLVLPLSLLGALLAPALAVFGGSAAGSADLTEYVRVILEPSALAPSAEQAPGAVLLPYAALTVVWLLGMVLLCGRWRWRSSGGQESASAPGIENKIRRALHGTGIARESIHVVSSPAIPSVTGLLRPRIVLSLPVVESLGPEELRAALLHEEQHRRRWDTVRAVIQRVILVLFFFYPPVWWIVGRLRTSAELACDESVLSRGVSPAVYARALARVLATNLGMMPAARPAEVCLNRQGGLPARLHRIENAWRYRAMTKHRILAALALLVVCASFVVPALQAGSGLEKIKLAEVDDRFADLGRLALDPNPVTLNFDRTPLPPRGMPNRAPSLGYRPPE